jgi:hypothetical protein
MQRQHVQQAAQNPALFAKANGGRPPIAATPRAAAFNAPGIVGARGAAPPAHPLVQAAHGNKPNAPRTAGQTNGAHAPQALHAQAANGNQPKAKKPPAEHAKPEAGHVAG